jgi:hypothetical protein
MARFLSTALPGAKASGPVSLFNLFKYRSGDPSVHDKYMGDFKRKFGDSVGAKVKFMGPVKTQGLNKDKVSGLEDTCILLVSEGEAWSEKHFNSQTPLGYKTSWSEPDWGEDSDCDR